MKALITSGVPTPESTPGAEAKKRSAATPARSPESANAVTTTTFARTPNRRAVSKSSAAARIATPRIVRRRKTVSRTTAVIVTANVTTFTAGSETSPTCHTLSVQFGTPIPCGCAETKICSATWMKKLTANDVISCVISRDSQIGGLHLSRAAELLGRAGGRYLTGPQDVAPIAEVQRLVDVLVNHQDAQALLVAEMTDQVEDLPDQHRRKSQRRLVEQQKSRSRHE